MPWPEPVRRFESPEDKELRAELSELLGYSPNAALRNGGPSGAPNFFGAKPTPELVALAEKLRAEAQRRRNTSRHRSGWMLIAAGLPIALALTGLGSWGVQQKRKADQAAAAMQELKIQQDRNREASEAEIQRSRERAGNPGLQLAAAPKAEAEPKAGTDKSRNKRLDPYPVIPVDRGVAPGPAGTTQVKSPH